MIALKKIIAEIKAIEKINRNDMKQRDIKALTKKHSFLSTLKFYLEGKPTETFVQKEQDRIVNRIALIENYYKQPTNVTLSEEKKHKKEFDKENGIPKLKEQAKTLKYILNN